jgi:antitoxin CptB
MEGSSVNDGNDAVDTIETRRKKARFRAWHRGMREMDLILGSFADEAIATMSAADLDEFENLLQLPDAELLTWFTGAVPVPEIHNTELFRRIASHRRYDRT